MYHPYFRGRQNELIVIRENAKLLAKCRFVPIIEPVKEATGGLVRALRGVADSNGTSVLIANPACGDFEESRGDIGQVIATKLSDIAGLSIGIRVDAASKLDGIASLVREHEQHPLTILHCGYPDGRRVAEVLERCPPIRLHVFLEESCGKLYRRHFRASDRALLRDGFKKRRTNREYPYEERFSELHVTFADEGMTGFGDFLIVGDDYQEAGGPAYAVAIHLTYIDPRQDDAMFVLHFVSDTTDTPQDPAGKFAEALQKLVDEVQLNQRPIMKTEAVGEFLELHRKRHFPGLGVVKKLSMQHHMETMAGYFNMGRNIGL